MKRILALILSLVCILVFAACSTTDNDNSKPQATTPNQSANSEPNNTTAPTENTIATETNDTTTSQENTVQYGALQNVLDTHGFPFRFWHSEGADYYDFIFTADNVQREIFVNFDGPHTMSNLSWSITGNELVISGDWEETFTLDVDLGKATSVNDGKEYRISIQKQDGEHLVWLPLASITE